MEFNQVDSNPDVLCASVTLGEFLSPLSQFPHLRHWDAGPANHACYSNSSPRETQTTWIVGVTILRALIVFPKHNTMRN